MSLERNIQRSVENYLKTVPRLWFLKIHGTAFARSGVPDFLGVYRGVPFWIELKQPGRTPDPRQVVEMRRLTHCGARGIVATSVAEVRAFVEALAVN